MIYAFIASILWGISYYLYNKLILKGFNFWFISSIYIFWNLFSIYMSRTNFETNLSLIKENYILVSFYFIIGLLANLTIYLAFKETSHPFLVTLLEMLYPLVVLLIMVSRGEEEFSFQKGIGFCIVFIGIYVTLKK